MKFKQFISAIFFMATSENFVSSSSSTELDTVLDYIGIKKLHEQGITGKGVKACIFDDYSKRYENADPYHSHGDVVSEYYERTALESSTFSLHWNEVSIYNTTKKVIHSLEDVKTNGGLLTFFKDHNIRIMNQSFSFIGDYLYDIQRKNTFELDTLSSDYSYQHNPLGCYSQYSFLHWMDSVIQLTKRGLVVILSAGNEALSLTMSPKANAFHFLNEVINENPENPGAIIFAGSSQFNHAQANPKLASYSNTAGIVENTYLHIPTSLTYLENPSVLSNANSSVINKLFKFLPTMFQATSLDKKDRLPTAWWGTSFAAPTLSGMVALLMEAFPNATGKQIANLLLSTAHLPDSKNTTNYTYGRGMPNVYTAYLKGLELKINDDRDVLTSLYPTLSLWDSPIDPEAVKEALATLPLLSLGDCTIDPEAFKEALAQIPLFYKITSLEKKD